MISIKRALDENKFITVHLVIVVIDNESTIVRVMAWNRQSAGHKSVVDNRYISWKVIAGQKHLTPLMIKCYYKDFDFTQ